MRVKSEKKSTPHVFEMIERGRLPEFSGCQEEARNLLLASPERPSDRTASRAGGKLTPSTIMSPAITSRASTEIRSGVFFACELLAASPRVHHERGPPSWLIDSEAQTAYPRLPRGSFTDKEKK